MCNRTCSEAVTARRACAPSNPARVVIPFPTCAACGGSVGPKPWTLYITDHAAGALVDVKVCDDCVTEARENRAHGVAITRALLAAFDAATGAGADHG